jgi:two-component system chemotaxis response regulator CheY
VPKRVLIADDAVFFRTALKEILSSGGFEVVAEASNGIEAVALAKAHEPDIVILDMVMPEKTGIEAAREIVKMNPGLKIVMCSSLGYEPVVESAMQAGACAYITKPLNREEVLKTLGELYTKRP